MSKLGIILQARTESTRMPEKVILPFFHDQSILDLLLEKVKKTGILAVLATTAKPADDRICIIAEKHGIPFFRGSEDDVLERFIHTAHQFQFEKIIRVCADNPFLDLTYINLLVTEFENSNDDYMSFVVEGYKPAILTHFGFWAEAVRLDALEKAQKLTDEKLYHEHVTNFIYGNPDLFTIRFIPADPLVFSRKDIRMTIDTPEDFHIQQVIYTALSKENPNFAIREIVYWLDRHPEIIEKMKNEIRKNQK